MGTLQQRRDAYKRLRQLAKSAELHARLSIRAQVLGFQQESADHRYLAGLDAEAAHRLCTGSTVQQARLPL